MCKLTYLLVLVQYYHQHHDQSRRRSIHTVTCIVCKCTCICVGVCVYVYVFLCRCTHMYVHVCTCTYMYVYVCVFVSNMHDTRMHACMCVHMCVAYMFVTISAVDSGAVGDRTGRQRERERERGSRQRLPKIFLTSERTGLVILDEYGRLHRCPDLLRHPTRFIIEACVH